MTEDRYPNTGLNFRRLELDRRFDEHVDGKPFNPYASLRELRRKDPARLNEALALLKHAFRLYEGHDRCRLFAVLCEGIERKRAIERSGA
jgi:hypothetical protein